MKKNFLYTIIAVAMVLVCAFALVACNEEVEGDPEFPKYNITLENGRYYTLSSDKTVAESVDTITITVTVLDPDKKVAAVKYGEQYAHEIDDVTFKFSMPARDVTVSAVIEDRKEQLASDSTSRPFMSFASSNVKTLVPNTGVFNMHIALNASYMTILNYEIKSSNQAVIPNDAFSVEKDYVSGSNIIASADVVVDTTKVAKGSTWVTIYFQNGNSSSQKGTIIVRLTVSEQIEVEVWTETLTFDVKSIANAEKYTYLVAIYNRDFVKGMPEELEYQEFKDLQVKDGKIIVEIKYVKGQDFAIGFFAKEDGSSASDERTLLEALGNGSTLVGFNQYKNGVLTFVSDGASLTIGVQ